MKNLVKRNALIYSERNLNSNKFYIIEMMEENGCYAISIKYGRLGKRPTCSVTDDLTKSKADSIYSKKYSEKIRKGYENVALEDIIFNEGEFYN